MYVHVGVSNRGNNGVVEQRDAGGPSPFVRPDERCEWQSRHGEVRGPGAL